MVLNVMCYFFETWCTYCTYSYSWNVVYSTEPNRSSSFVPGWTHIWTTNEVSWGRRSGVMGSVECTVAVILSLLLWHWEPG